MQREEQSDSSEWTDATCFCVSRLLSCLCPLKIKDGWAVSLKKQAQTSIYRSIATLISYTAPLANVKLWFYLLCEVPPKPKFALAPAPTLLSMTPLLPPSCPTTRTVLATIYTLVLVLVLVYLYTYNLHYTLLHIPM